MRSYFVYILASKKNGTLYIGVTNDLERRVSEHKQKLIPGFTKDYSVQKLVYFEETNDIHIAIQREKCLKKWNRKWKLDLIEKMNPRWNDLADYLDPRVQPACPAGRPEDDSFVIPRRDRGIQEIESEDDGL